MHAVPLSGSRVPAPDPAVVQMQIRLAWELYEARLIEEAHAPDSPGWIKATVVGALLEELDRLRVNALADRERELMLAADILAGAVDEHDRASRSKDWNSMGASWERAAAAAKAYHLVRSDPDWRHKLAGAIRTLLDLSTDARRDALQQEAATAEGMRA